MGGGGKGGEQVTKVELPEELQTAAKGVLGGAMASASLPYRANRGVTVAALSPQEQAAFQGANEAAAAFGLPTASNREMGGYLPTPERAANGMQGYSSGALYDQNIARSMSRTDQQNRERILQGYGGLSRELGFSGAPQAGKGGGTGSSGKGGGGASSPKSDGFKPVGAPTSSGRQYFYNPQTGQGEYR